MLATVAHSSFADNEIRVYRRVSTSSGLLDPELMLQVGAGEDFQIDLTTPPWNNLCPGCENEVILINATNPTTQSVGHITLRGSRNAESQLRVIVGSDLTDIPQVPSEPIAAGCLHWSGIHAIDLNGNAGQDTGIARSIVLAAAVYGNFQGDPNARIEVGRVYRLQASEIGNGVLSIPVHAFQADASYNAINYIVVRNSITAPVIAQDDIYTTARCGIDRVFVGSQLPVAGISGRIAAVRGKINSIVTRGPITTPFTTAQPGIQAGFGIDQIIAGALDAQGHPVPIDISTTVVANATDQNSAYLKIINATGDLTEKVNAGVLGGINNYESEEDDRGIRVDGTITAPISIATTFADGMIIAEDFAPGADIIIGYKLSAQIKARNGSLRRIYVGYNSIESNRGMTGTTSIPYGVPFSRPSIIAAKHIEELHLYAMVASGSVAPNVTADEITQLDVGRMEWGLIEGKTPDRPGFHYPYVKFEKVQVAETFTTWTCGGGFSGQGSQPASCANVVAEIWSDTFDTFEIFGNHGGILHLYTLPWNRDILIGGSLYNYYRLGYSAPDSYPRLLHDAITVDQPQGLHGRIVINQNGVANPDLLDHGYSACAVNTASGFKRFFYQSPLSDDPQFELPTYTIASAPLGGGAIGISRFYLYDSDCFPVNEGSDPPQVLLQSQFSSVCENVPVVGITLQWYGPVRTDLETGSPVVLEFIRFINNTPFGYPVPPAHYSVTVKRGTELGSSREIHIIGKADWAYGAGVYRVKQRAGVSPSGKPFLYCDTVDLQPAVQDFEYWFYLGPDCNCDGITDTEDCPHGGCTCPADFNQDGGVDGSDVQAFFLVWEAGESPADTNCDGGVDGLDVEAFFIAWEAGDPTCGG
ncbi:MAG: hypothetical protein JSR77_02390 [Planctomycetes bacterium]|nr:hypothetical protein [Planctomycetota bacterium]